ncbi:MAG: glycosyltransferase family 39 protein [Lachnospiraceae bacterium]|nr:glycosyltransferase family 39 protein [Lachnospiraceae bacterium]
MNYAELVLQGKFPYRDFYYYLPPLNLLFDIITWKLSFGLLIVYRAWWFAQRILIFELLLFLLCRYYKPLYAFIACSFASVLGTASVYDLFGDYNQTVVLLAVCLVYCAVAFADASSEKDKCRKLIKAGVVLGLMFLCKQTIFVAAVFTFFIVLAIACRLKKDGSFPRYIAAVFGGVMIIVVPALAVLGLNGAMIPFIEQAFLHTGGKGSLFATLVIRLINKLPHIFAWIMIGEVLMMIYLGNKKNVDGGNSQSGRMAFIVFLLTGCVIFQNNISVFLNALSDYTRFSYIQVIICIGLLLFIAVLMTGCFKRPALRISEEFSLGMCFASCAFILIAGYIADMQSEELANVVFNESGLYSVITEFLYFAVFYAVILVLLKKLLSVKRSADSVNEGKLWISCGAFAAIYSSSMASGSELPYNGMWIGLCFILCEAFSVMVYDKRLEHILKYSLTFGCGILSFACMAQKTMVSYVWWGCDSESRSEKTYTTDISALKGFRFSEDMKNTLEGITELIEDNCDEDAVIYGFPYIKLFNILTERYNFETFVPVMFYDVVDDLYVDKENELLKDNLPDIIIWQDIPGCMETHEEAYRDGELLEQRNTEAYFKEILPTEYYILGTYDNITVYKLRDNSGAACFAGGSGTYEDPYLIETAEQLINFSTLVNEGSSFEGCYISQTEDIDLAGYDWTPVGEFGLETYFCGVYNGNGHIIKNIELEESDSNVGGVFGVLGGEVYNLGVEYGSISGACAGGIASHSGGVGAKIINCYTDISVSGYRAGGIADNFSGAIENCFSFGELTGIETANVVSYNSAQSISNVFVCSEALTSAFYTEDLNDSRITYCAEEAFASGTVADQLNTYVEEWNSEDEEDSILLNAWTVGSDGHPVFAD